ncbi:PLP-dependent aminotransferase family protein [Novosphingobium sp. Gsoil 351]|uniref:aminotransferase-like domain-containing protein n=1 Tax=Novosphingobium sp. Gsoil 351 TaxID=2675225 RepID=UPI0012B46C6E|nr:PLP-dependent aminotransferase family protein [Novosphingobium sp. Gsoil 351]QGN55719.1 aminotransferase class I/II-fold pyridoxal phosphate-dependent enzyme [Novosphingobium sp. Gsoil 351]
MQTCPDSGDVRGQNALHAIMSVIAKPGDRIACGRFVYPGFLAIAQRMSVELVPLPEMTGDALTRACQDGPISALYVVPTNDNPTTLTLSTEQREDLTRSARLHGIQIIEDDAYGLLSGKPLPPLSKLAPELGWYVLSTSKTISPALRVAFVRVPSAAQALQLAADVHETSVMAPPLNAAVVTTWLRDGSFDRLVSAVRSEASWRSKLASDVLCGNEYACDPQGFHLWLKLPGGVAAADLSQRLSMEGIGAIPSDRFTVGPCREQALRISLGGVAERETLETALKVLDAHVRP